MTKKKEKIEDTPELEDNEFNDSDLDIESMDIPVVEEKPNKQAYEKRRKLEEILEEKRRRSKEDYLWDDDESR